MVVFANWRRNAPGKGQISSSGATMGTNLSLSSSRHWVYQVISTARKTSTQKTARIMTNFAVGRIVRSSTSTLLSQERLYRALACPTIEPQEDHIHVEESRNHCGNHVAGGAEPAGGFYLPGDQHHHRRDDDERDEDCRRLLPTGARDTTNHRWP